VVDDPSSRDGPNPVRVGRRRGVRAVAVLLGVSVLSGGVGWFAARSIKSPAEVAARTASPAASRITAPVEFRVLRSTLFTRGTVRFGSPKAVTLPASAAKTGSQVVTAPPVKGAVLKEGSKAADVGGRPVIVLQGPTPMYRDIRPGDRGDDVTELKTALARLGFKSSKGDLYDAAAQHAVSEWMRKVGYEPFGPTETQQTQLRTSSDAVRKAMEQVISAQANLVKGSVPITPDKVLAADEAVRTANDRAGAARTDGERTVAQAELAVAQKQAAVVAAQQAVDRSAADVSAVLSVTEAEQALATAKQRVTDADAAVVKANRSIGSARADADDAAQAVIEVQATLDDANAALTAAQAELVRVKAKPVPTVLSSPNVFTLDTDSYNASVKQAEQAVTSANVQVRSATSSLRASQRSAAKSSDLISDAQAAADAAAVTALQARDSVKVAELRLTQARNSAGTGGASGAGSGSGSTAGAGSAGSNPQQTLTFAQADLVAAQKAVDPARRAAAAAIRAADAQVRIALAQRKELGKAADVASLKSALASARESKTSSEADLARLEAQVGIVVPANEIVFFTALPLQVDESKLAAGDALSGVLMTVATQRLAVDASVDPGDAPSLHVGQAAEIEATDLGLTVPGTITKIGASPGTNGADATRIYVEVTPTETAASTEPPVASNTASSVPVFSPDRKPTLADLNGISVKVTVPISTTNGNVLAVPTAAVSAAADGTTRVEVEDTPDKPTRYVTVTAGLRADGYVQVTPSKLSELKTGDLVVTGTKGGQLLEGVPGPNDRTTGSGPATSDSTLGASDAAPSSAS
jgi:hypothetical protein